MRGSHLGAEHDACECVQCARVLCGLHDAADERRVGRALVGVHQLQHGADGGGRAQRVPPASTGR